MGLIFIRFYQPLQFIAFLILTSTSHAAPYNPLDNIKSSKKTWCSYLLSSDILSSSQPPRVSKRESKFEATNKLSEAELNLISILSLEFKNISEESLEKNKISVRPLIERLNATFEFNKFNWQDVKFKSGVLRLYHLDKQIKWSRGATSLYLDFGKVSDAESAESLAEDLEAVSVNLLFESHKQLQEAIHYLQSLSHRQDSPRERDSEFYLNLKTLSLKAEASDKETSGLAWILKIKIKPDGDADSQAMASALLHVLRTLTLLMSAQN